MSCKKQSPCSQRSRRAEHRAANGKRALRFAGPVATLFIALTSVAEARQVNTEYRGFRRLMPGGSRAEIQAAQAMGFQAFLAQQLNHTALPDVEGIGGGAPGVDDYWPSVNWQPLEISTAAGAMPPLITPEIARANMRYARIWRSVYSSQGLYETMTWEWDRHFNIDQLKRVGWFLFPYWNRVVTRKHAFGQFRELLHASAGDNADRASAMLLYLDNLANKCSGPLDPVNENYGRERIELHGLGSDDQQYTEADVRNMSRFGSGREFDATATNASWGMVKFDPAFHCAVTLPFLGMSFPGNPAAGTQQTAAVNWMVDYQTTAGVRTCAEFIATKLVRALLTDAPVNAAQQLILDGAVVDAVNVFGTNGDIKAMIAAIMTDANIDGLLAGNDPPYKYMEPVKFVTCLLAATEADLDSANMGPISEIITGLGERPYAFGPPIGYPQAIQAWIENQPGRWDFADRLCKPNSNPGTQPNSTIPGVEVDVDALFTAAGGYSLATVGLRVNQILTAGNLDQIDERVIQFYANTIAPSSTPSEIRWKSLALGAMAPSFSLY